LQRQKGINIKILQNGEWVAYSLYNSIDFDERLDEQFDTGSVQVISNSATPFADYCVVRMDMTDNLEVKSWYYCGFDSVEKRGGGYYIHTLELCEPTRLLMGTLIDGRKVTQPMEGSNEAKQTLYDVLIGLLNTFELLPFGEKFSRSREKSRIITEHEYDSSLTDTKCIMENVTSPEFHWEAETSLWECLCDIGNVINAIPRLTYNKYNAEYPFSVLLFDMINESAGEYVL
jgi:hypothetical protein